MTTANDTCIHYWLIQPAQGPVSQGQCQSCGATREFQNYVESTVWVDGEGNDRRQGRGKRSNDELH